MGFFLFHAFLRHIKRRKLQTGYQFYSNEKGIIYFVNLRVKKNQDIAS